MKYFITIITLLLLSPLHAENSVFCEVLGVESKRIQCTFFTQRVSFDRNISFHWKSPDKEYDFREHSFVLPAHHGSVYDYRYYHGRSLGEWKVLVKDEHNQTMAQTVIKLNTSENLPK
ncbi:MAG: hypothetical protein U9P71_06990 [Campylobacterota bacterium]|nr:hypothetical protein [Campylobacterota bacterium]